jgi:phosphocarrier protein
VPRRVLHATIVNRLGLHARPAMAFVDCAAGFRCAVSVRKGDTEVDGKSIMQMMMLAATKGTTLEVTCDGDDADAACEAIASLVSDGFGEE